MEDERGPITDPTAIRALAHPTRLALLEVLAGEREATATRCAELTGQSVASCSFHLRTLAKHGFIERAPGPGREKPWRLTTTRQEIASEGDAATSAAGNAFNEFFVAHEAGRLQNWLRRRPAEPEEWRRATILSGATAWLTPEELDEVGADVAALIEKHFARRLREGDPKEPGRRPVRLFVGTSIGLPEPGPSDGSG